MLNSTPVYYWLGRGGIWGVLFEGGGLFVKLDGDIIVVVAILRYWTLYCASKKKKGYVQNIINTD